VWAAAPGPELGECVDVVVEVESLQERGVPVLGVVVVGPGAAPVEGGVREVEECRADGVIERGGARVDVKLCLELASGVRGTVLVDAVGHDPHPTRAQGSQARTRVIYVVPARYSAPR
jgi:uncharacterized protein related to proFAR isomerase